jgi:hypothetical protein
VIRRRDGGESMFQTNDSDFMWAVTKAAFIVVSGFVLIVGLAWAAFRSTFLEKYDRRLIANDEMPNTDRLSGDQTKRVAS